METRVTVQLVEKGLLIPHDSLGDLAMEELEAVRKERVIIIRPRSAPTDERSRVRQVLRAAGMLYEAAWQPPAVVLSQVRAGLARKLGQAGPLSEVIIADRADRS